MSDQENVHYRRSFSKEYESCFAKKQETKALFRVYVVLRASGVIPC